MVWKKWLLFSLGGLDMSVFAIEYQRRKTHKQQMEYKNEKCTVNLNKTGLNSKIVIAFETVVRLQTFLSLLFLCILSSTKLTWVMSLNYTQHLQPTKEEKASGYKSLNWVRQPREKRRKQQQKQMKNIKFFTCDSITFFM